MSIKKDTKPAVKKTLKKDTKVTAKKEKVKKLSKKDQKLMAENERRWKAYQNKNKDISPVPYKISGVYQDKTPIMHKKFGWGYILSIRNDRLEVMFKETVKFLVSNNLGVS